MILTLPRRVKRLTCVDFLAIHIIFNFELRSKRMTWYEKHMRLEKVRLLLCLRDDWGSWPAAVYHKITPRLREELHVRFFSFSRCIYVNVLLWGDVCIPFQSMYMRLLAVLTYRRWPVLNCLCDWSTCLWADDCLETYEVNAWRWLMADVRHKKIKCILSLLLLQGGPLFIPRLRMIDGCLGKVKSYWWLLGWSGRGSFTGLMWTEYAWLFL